MSDAADSPKAKAKACGNAAMKEKDFAKAIEHYSEAIKLDADDHVLYSNRSAAHSSAGDHDKALADAEACIAKKPDWAKGHGRRGDALFFKGRFMEAVAAYKEGLKLEPDNAKLKGDVQRAQDTFVRLSKRQFDAGRSPPTMAKPAWLETLLLIFRATMVGLALAFILSMSSKAYKYFFWVASVNCLASVFPDLQARNWPTVLMSQRVHSIPLAVLFSFSPPFAFGVMPILLPEIAPLCLFVAKLVGPAAGALHSVGINPSWPSLVAQSELLVGAVTVAQLFAPGRNILLPVFYLQWLRLRCMVGEPMGNSYTKQQFQHMGAVVGPTLSRVPVVSTLYGWLCSGLASMVRMPASAEEAKQNYGGGVGSRIASKCTIM